MASESKKYLLRFGPALFILIFLISVLMPGNVNVILYKFCLVIIAVILAELVWILFFKPIFGKIEETRPYAQRSILIFRGMLYAAIVLAVCLGL